MYFNRTKTSVALANTIGSKYSGLNNYTKLNGSPSYHQSNNQRAKQANNTVGPFKAFCADHAVEVSLEPKHQSWMLAHCHQIIVLCTTYKSHPPLSKDDLHRQKACVQVKQIN